MILRAALRWRHLSDATVKLRQKGSDKFLVDVINVPQPDSRTFDCTESRLSQEVACQQRIHTRLALSIIEAVPFRPLSATDTFARTSLFREEEDEDDYR